MHFHVSWWEGTAKQVDRNYVELSESNSGNDLGQACAWLVGQDSAMHSEAA